MSDSRFLDAVGFEGMYDLTDEGGWLHEALPVEDVGFAVNARVESELDLLTPQDRELRELAWLELGFEHFRELEEAALHKPPKAGKAAEGGAGGGSSSAEAEEGGEAEGEGEEEEEWATEAHTSTGGAQ